MRTVVALLVGIAVSGALQIIAPQVGGWKRVAAGSLLIFAMFAAGWLESTR